LFCPACKQATPTVFVTIAPLLLTKEAGLYEKLTAFFHKVVSLFKIEHSTIKKPYTLVNILAGFEKSTGTFSKRMTMFSKREAAF